MGRKQAAHSCGVAMASVMLVTIGAACSSREAVRTEPMWIGGIRDACEIYHSSAEARIDCVNSHAGLMRLSIDSDNYASRPDDRDNQGAATDPLQLAPTRCDGGIFVIAATELPNQIAESGLTTSDYEQVLELKRIVEELAFDLARNAGICGPMSE